MFTPLLVKAADYHVDEVRWHSQGWVSDLDVDILFLCAINLP